MHKQWEEGREGREGRRRDGGRGRERKGGEGRGGEGRERRDGRKVEVNIASFGSLGERNGKRTAMDCFMVH